MENRCIGSNFDEFLAEEGLLEEAEAVARQRVEQFSSRSEEVKNGEAPSVGELELALYRRSPYASAFGNHR